MNIQNNMVSANTAGFASLASAVQYSLNSASSNYIMTQSPSFITAYWLYEDIDGTVRGKSLNTIQALNNSAVFIYIDDEYGYKIKFVD